MEELTVKDGRDDRPVFIHSELDDYGLSCIEFRVYARLARRSGSGMAFESVPKMAADFEVKDRTIQRALRVLTRCRLITETPRPGKPTLYTLTARSAWLPKAQLKSIRDEITNKAAPAQGGDIRAGGAESEGVTPEAGVGVTPERDEGTTTQGSTEGETARARGNFLPDWLPPTDWAKWVGHLTQKGKPLTIEQAKAQIEKLDKFRARGMPPDKVIAQAIERGWQGFYPLKGEQNGDGEAATQQPRTQYAGRAPVTRDFSKYPART